MGVKISSLALEVKSVGIKEATENMKSLAEASKSVDAETKAFITSQAKLETAQKKGGASAEAAARGVSTQELAMIKNQEAALKMHNALLRVEATNKRIAEASNARGISSQELSMVKAHEQALKMNAAFDKQADSLKNLNSHGSIWNNTLKSMAVAASAYVGVNFVSGIIQQADAWGLMQAKLKLSTGSMQSAVSIQTALFESAQKIRIPLEDSVQLFNRMSIPLQK